MRWLKRYIWKAGITLAGMLLLLVLMVWVPVSAAGAYEETSGLATPGTVQVTPTIDATVTALNKEKLLQDVDQQRHTLGNWFWNNGAALVSALVLVIAGAFTLFRYLRDQRSEREKQREDRQTELEKRAEERFQSAVEGLSSEREEAKIGATILLRTFLRPGYEQFYTQTFDLAVAHLRLRRTSQSPEVPNTPLPLTTLGQALIMVFKEAFPLAREEWGKNRKEEPFKPRSLDGTGIHLDRAFLWKADLKQVWIPWASLQEVNLSEADLRAASLWRSDLTKAKLSRADLSRADLGQDNLYEADLREAQLRGATLWGANLSMADLSMADPRKDMPHGASDRDNLEVTLLLADLHGANLYKANLRGADLRLADLREANLSGADLQGAKLIGVQLCGDKLTEVDLGQVKLTKVDRSALYLADLRWRADGIWVDTPGAEPLAADLSMADLYPADLSMADLSGVRNLEHARSLKGTILRGVKGLTKEQLAACKAKGAIIDEDTTASSSQSPISPSLPLQSKDTQASSVPSAQVSTPPPNIDGSSAASSQQSPEV